MRKIQICSVVVLTLLVFASTAYAFGEIRYADRPLNLRSARSAKARWVGSLYPGQKVRIAYLKEGWVAVFEPNETRNTQAAAVGYSNVKYLKKKRTRHEPKEWGEVVYANRAVNIRTKPNRRGKKVGQLKTMMHVKADFPDGDWTRVFPMDATIRSEMGGMGYCSAKYLDPATEASLAKAGLGKAPAPEEQEVAAQPEKPAPPTFQLVELTSTINVRMSRTSSSPLVTTLREGDRVKVGLLRSGWYAVFKENSTVLVESGSMGYSLQSIIDTGSKAVVEATAPVKSEVRQAVVPVESSVVVSKTVTPPPTPEPKAVAPVVPKPAPVKQEPVREPVAPKPAPQAVAQAPAKQQTIVIDRKAFTGAKRPDPTPNKTAHGYQYRIVEKSETRQLGEPWIVLKVFLSTTKLPNEKALKDFASTLWKENRRVAKNVAVLVYLPGMDMEDLSYGVVKFDYDNFLEIWVRKATLFGTDFM
ncbi:SH3 domain-containing protein [Pseudodesulfovibrio sediminis]|uniref:SH3 domain-containing protein n=1 Tax=Pseudodesulfovibrio sediminis TaxID=2810563 RepID=A0ABN6EQG5_9BACT|nr:SH3 domain-containing protein [Pseudodesulfovibrio sediminis]BCS87667.1 hypothetical protein PSDVSF_09090 [Pseudodesulfovibrio sediminis]